MEIRPFLDLAQVSWPSEGTLPEKHAMKATVTAVSSGGEDDLSKTVQEAIEVNFEGIVGDHHAGPSRKAYSGEREPKGTVLRNDRQWSAVSDEELAEMSERLDLDTPLAAHTLGANLCIRGVPELSRLPRGTRLKFPSGAALIVEAAEHRGEALLAEELQPGVSGGVFLWGAADVVVTGPTEVC